MSRLLLRVLETGVDVTLHPGPVGRSGGDELARSQRIYGDGFASYGDYVTNAAIIECETSRAGTARYFALWVDGAVEASGQLRDAVELILGESNAYFPRGEMIIARATT